MELVPREGERISTVLGVEETIVGVLVASDTNGGEIIVIDPDPGGLIDICELISIQSYGRSESATYQQGPCP